MKSFFYLITSTDGCKKNKGILRMITVPECITQLNTVFGRNKIYKKIYMTIFNNAVG